MNEVFLIFFTDLVFLNTEHLTREESYNHGWIYVSFFILQMILNLTSFYGKFFIKVRRKVIVAMKKKPKKKRVHANTSLIVSDIDIQLDVSEPYHPHQTNPKEKVDYEEYSYSYYTEGSESGGGDSGKG